MVYEIQMNKGTDKNPLDLISVITAMLERAGETHNFHRFWQRPIETGQENRWTDERVKERRTERVRAALRRKFGCRWRF